MELPKIIYTLTDEAPALATYSLLPIIQAFAGAAATTVETRDISLAARILAVFPERLTEDQRMIDDLSELGALVAKPEANIIKLPNISASLPQLKAAIEELRSKGYDLPEYPENPVTDEEKQVRRRYDTVKGSAVNPVLREGNSLRRAPASVKAYARNHPHLMGEWRSDSKSHVASMQEGDFYGSEKSTTVQRAGSCQIELVAPDGEVTILKESIALDAGEVIDAAVMSRSALRSFLKEEMDDSCNKDLLFSIHLKATMMKVSDPVIFGHAVEVFLAPVFKKYRETFSRIGVDPCNGMNDLIKKIESLPPVERSEVEADIKACFAERPDLAMVDSDKGITNLHVPSDVIIDASMPAAIRSSGQMWGPDGKQKDTKFVIPDRCYAGVYQAAVDDCREHGALNPVTMGTVPNVGLMAQKAEEYGSHDKTFVVGSAGQVRVVDVDGTVLLDQPVEKGDIFRMCQVKDAPVRNWVKLAVEEARSNGVPAIFWLDSARAHDAELISKVKSYLTDHNTEGLEIQILPPEEATRLSFSRMRKGEDTISVTGNVLRDYLTDLFPILEVGTSARMLSTVPLMSGGGLFETGAGGSAPKHVKQLLAENHLRWDSLGEYLALAVSLNHFADRYGNSAAGVLGRSLDTATGIFLEEDRSPKRKVGGLDTRGSHYYLALYWARALAAQDDDLELKSHFASLAERLTLNENTIIGELGDVQGSPVDLGGYYLPDPELAALVMRPSKTFNEILFKEEL